MLRVRVRSRPGHPWVFANEILDPPVAQLPPGDAVEVADPAGRVLGRGYCNPHSLITIRMVTRGDADLDTPALADDIDFAARDRPDPFNRIDEQPAAGQQQAKQGRPAPPAPGRLV